MKHFKDNYLKNSMTFTYGNLIFDLGLYDKNYGHQNNMCNVFKVYNQNIRMASFCCLCF